MERQIAKKASQLIRLVYLVVAMGDMHVLHQSNITWMDVLKDFSTREYRQ